MLPNAPKLHLCPVPPMMIVGTNTPPQFRLIRLPNLQHRAVLHPMTMFGFRFTAPASGLVEMSILNITNPTGGSKNMYAMLYSGVCNNLVNRRCINGTSEVFTGLTSWQEYFIRVMSNVAGQSVSFSVGLREIPAPMDNATCAGVLTLTTNFQTGTTLGLTAANSSIACYGSSGT